MKIKSILALITSLALVFTLAACTGNGESGGNGKSGQTGELWTDTFEGVTLKRLLWYQPSESETALVKQFEERTGATIVDEIVDYQNYNQKIADSIAAGDPYDIGYIYGAFFPTQIIAGLYQPIPTEYLSSNYQVDSSSAEALAKGGFDFNKMDYYKWNGNYYGFSSYWDVDMLVLYFRTDMIEQAGLKSPLDYVAEGNWNHNTFYELASKLTNTRAGIAGYSAGGENTRGFGEFVGGYGVTVVTYDSNGVPSQNLGDPKVLEAYNFVQKMSYGSGAVVDRETSFRKGTAAMSIDGLYEAPKMMSDSNVPSVVKENWDIAPIPLAAGNENGAYTTDWLKAIGIVQGSQNQKAVAAFALHMSQGKGDNSWESAMTEEQIARITPYYANIIYPNYAYGTLIDDNSNMVGRIAAGEDVSQLLSEYKTSFQAQIDKIIKE